MTNEDKGFHWRDGWYFKRLESGAVKVQKWREWPGLQGNRILEMQAEIPAAEWASIITEVSGDPNQYARAEAFHAGVSR